MTKIKICGLTRAEEIDAVNRLLPDYIGFVFADSRRRVTPDTARRLRERLDVRIKAVGVFVNWPVTAVAALSESGIIDIAQLHGDEDREYIMGLKQMTACPVIKAVRVRSAAQISEAEMLPCDMLLLDSFREGIYGGSGESFDLSVIPGLAKPFFLAGGLNNENIGQAILKCRPFGVDISSGAETDGVKDEKKIRQIIRTVSGLRK